MTMTKQAGDVGGGGTWGPREAAAEWRRGAAARLQAFGPATKMMLDLAGVAEGSRVLDVGAGAGDSTVVAARRAGSRGRVLATDVSASMLEAAAELAGPAGLDQHPAGPEAGRPVRSDRVFGAWPVPLPLPPARDRVPPGPPHLAGAGAIRRVPAGRSRHSGGRVRNGWLPGDIRPHGSHSAAFPVPGRGHAVRTGAASPARADGQAQPRRTGASLGRDRACARAIRWPAGLRLTVRTPHRGGDEISTAARAHASSSQARIAHRQRHELASLCRLLANAPASGRDLPRHRLPLALARDGLVAEAQTTPVATECDRAMVQARARSRRSARKLRPFRSPC